MKTFSNFLREATETSASRQAKLLGLVGDGHGGWYDEKGNFKAKTEKGKLKFYGGNKKPGEEEVGKKKSATPEPAGRRKVAQPQPQQQQKAQPQQQQSQQPEQEGEETAAGIVVVFGRFNPPTVGHEKVLQTAAREAKRIGGDLKIYPSRTKDNKKNPLDAGVKIEFMKKMFPDYEENIINDSDSKTIFDVLTSAYGDAYKNVTIVVGQDRLAEFQGLAQKYNGTDLYSFDEISVISAGARDPDGEGVEGMSASKMRQFALDGDYTSFADGIPKTMGSMQKRELYNSVRSALGAKKDVKEQAELWEIAPKLDPDTLRDNYLRGHIFNNDDIVENINTGLVGKIIRRGTTYLICVTENGIMFKSWLKDLKEYTEVKMDRLMRDKKHPNTLVGTNGFLKYARKMTPGCEKGVKVNK